MNSGAEALENLAQQRCDVIITDMTMPGMTGAVLLEEVRRLYPRTIRLILSGHSDRDQLMRCASSAHRFLAKPCDPELLIATLTHATSVATALTHEPLGALVGQITCLPSPPLFYLELQQRLQAVEVSAEEVGTAIGKDVAMTALVLKLVNSAFFGLPQKITTPTEAVAYLGVNSVRALVLSLHLTKEARRLGTASSFLNDLWGHSLRVSSGARTIAECEEAERHTVNEAAAAGLLHDSGKLILAMNFPEKVLQARQISRSQGMTISDAERSVFGCTHAEVGGYLFNLWGLPENVVRAISLHHTPRLDTRQEFTALTAVHVADVLAHRSAGQLEGGIAASWDEQYLDRSHWRERLSVWQERFLEAVAPSMTPTAG